MLKVNGNRLCRKFVSVVHEPAASRALPTTMTVFGVYDDLLPIGYLNTETWILSFFINILAPSAAGTTSIDYLIR